MTEQQQRGLTPQQVDVLLQPLMRARVKVQEGQSYLPQQDVRAHLTRIFGFGGWSSHVIETALVHEAPTLRVDKKTGKRNPERIDCLWRATVRLDVRDQHGNHLATYEDSATGDAQNSEPLAAHDLALKSAVSTALKRAATCLGDQFGLSLYNKGSMDAFVGRTLVGATAQPHDLADVPPATEEQDPDAKPQHAEPEAPQVTPEERAERQVTQAHQRRQERNSARHGGAVPDAKARLWDAFTEATDSSRTPAAERMAALEAECARREWNQIAQLHPDRLAELADHYEEKADDEIRARVARGE